MSVLILSGIPTKPSSSFSGITFIILLFLVFIETALQAFFL